MRKLRKILLIGILSSALAGALLLFWGIYIEPNRLTVTTWEIPLEEWAGTNNHIKMVVAGDFHAAPGDAGRMKKTVERMLQEKPDAFILVGDYCRGSYPHTTMPPAEIGEYLSPLAKIAPVYAILGNHDEAAGKSTMIDALEKAGIMVLEKKTLLTAKEGARLQLGGVPDWKKNKVTLEDVPERMSRETPYVLLSHSPDILPIMPSGLCNIVLSGHTHGGQICLPNGAPLITSSEYGTLYAYGLIHESGKKLLVTRGLGTSLTPVRLFCPPEIMILHFKGESPK